MALTQGLIYNFSVDAMIIEDGRVTASALKDVRDWLPQVKFPPLPDPLIVLFLLSCNNSVPETEQALYTNFQIKNHEPEMFDDRDMDRKDLRKVSRTIYSFYIPKRTDKDEVIHFSKLRDTRYSSFDMVPMIKYTMMLSDYLGTQKPPHGLIIITDMAGMSLLHLTRLKLREIGVFFKYVQEALPVRPTEIHILNANFVFVQLFNLAKGFMNRDLLQRIRVYRSSNCHGCVPTELFPEDYGGDMPDLEDLNRQTVAQLEQMKPYFDAEERLRKPLIFPN